MTIKQFVEKYAKELKINYAIIHRLIRIGAILENIHYVKSYRSQRARISINECALLQYLRKGK